MDDLLTQFISRIFQIQAIPLNSRQFPLKKYELYNSRSCAWSDNAKLSSQAFCEVILRLCELALLLADAEQTDEWISDILSR